MAINSKTTFTITAMAINPTEDIVLSDVEDYEEIVSDNPEDW